jgi:methanogenic corrinoid protein MtbC1
VAPAAAADSLRKQRQTAPNPDRGLDAWKRKLMTAIESLSPELLLKHCAEVEAAVGYQRAMESVVFTQLAALGERWHETAGAIAQEHCATLALRAYMTERFLRRGGESSKPASRKPQPTITLACVPGEAHDLPILHLANLLVDSGGIRPMVLAAGLPLKEILTTAGVMNSRLILLSGTMPVSPLELREWIAELESAGWEKKCVLAGSAFNNSRIFSESAVRAAAGNYTQAVELLLKLQTNNAD